MASNRQPPPTFGSRLREARERAGLTQKALASKIGNTEATISKWETDENEPPLEALRQLREILSVTVDWLLNAPNALPPPLVNVKKIRRAMRTLATVADALDAVASAVGELEEAVPPNGE